ncbi:MAG: cysteine-S-conjugate beta-lyase [Alphaproteobacteria bacterium]|jgi:cystathionine beta-lyase|nr:cysteine-S-conjugate beta-lyase [Alphaproteobacteria bacterium]
MARKDTKLIQAGRSPSLHAGAVNTPVYRVSTVLFPDLQTMRTEAQPYTYGRRGQPTTRALEQALCGLEGGARTVLTPSGLSACTLAILTVCGAGDHILVADSVYGPTRVFCQKLGKRYGISTTYFDPCIGAAIAEQFRPETKAVFLESPGSFTFEVQDVPAIAAIAHQRGAAVILDNTWATPLYFDAIGHGVDLSVQAVTKYIGGHADVLMGAITANAAFKDRLVETHGTLGHCSSGDEAYLALRGLRTLAVRLKRHQESATEIAAWLKTRPEVAQVIYPVLHDDPGHALWRRDFTGACGLFSIVLKPCPDAAITAMVDGLEHFGLGYSWGGFESLVVHGHFHRSFPPALEGPMLRLHIGLEDVEDLKADLAAGLERLRRAM